LPGVVLAFGDRAQLDDEIAIVVSSNRVDTALVYGGKFEINFNLIVYTRDSEDREKMTDYLVGKIIEKQDELGTDGIELLDISTGEDQEVYNETIDDYYYDSSLDMGVRVEYEAHKPLPIVTFRSDIKQKAVEQKSSQISSKDLIDSNGRINIQDMLIMPSNRFNSESLR